MRAKPDSCLGCALHSHGTDMTVVDGTGSLGVMRVGEASGQHEAREQRPFVEFAPAGGILERVTRQMSLSRAQFSTTNVVRCRPREDFLVGADYEFSAAEHCRSNLRAAIAERRPRCILALGNTAIRALTGWTGEKRTVTHLAGYVLPTLPDLSPEPIPVVCTFHPSYLRRGAMSHFEVVARHQRRAVRVAAGQDREWDWIGDDNESQLPSGSALARNYVTHPTLDDAWSFYQHVRDNASLVLSYDLETSESASLDEDASDGFRDTEIRLVQFSTGAGSGIAFPWEGSYKDCVRAVLGLPNVKCGHNVWLFDNKVLAAVGARERGDEGAFMPVGTVHDTLQMYHWWQPDLPAHLQFCAGFVQFPFPWKHLAGTDLALYGCADVDSDIRLYAMLEATLGRDGMWGERAADVGYVGQVAEVRPVLAAMERRGVPIDDARRVALDGEFERAQQELNNELQGRFPDDCRSVEPRRGRSGNYSYGYLRAPSDTTGLVQREFAEAGIDSEQNPCVVRVTRWCRLEPFLPNSAPQLIAYMKHHKHPVPRDLKKARSGDSDGETTAKRELVRLANKVGDDFYLKVIEYRELTKARGTYVDGFKPQADERVHTTFTFDTGTGQLSSRNPNVQNFPKHGRLAGALRGMVGVSGGLVLTEWDYKAYHVLTTGFEAESASWMRLARLDMHSFVAGVFRKDWPATVMEESDDALLDRFAWFKSDADRKRVRDKQAKPSILGVGFGMGKRRLYQENLESFPDERTAGRFLDVLQHLFPEVFAWQARVRKLAHEQQFLRSRFGAVRWFYEVFVWNAKRGGWTNGDQAEEAVAFLPANDAHGGMRLKLRALADRGMAERYGLFNVVHDSFQFAFPRALLDEHVAAVGPLLAAPCKVLTHPRLAPDGLAVETELSVGQNWSEMAAYALPAATTTQHLLKREERHDEQAMGIPGGTAGDRRGHGADLHSQPEVAAD